VKVSLVVPLYNEEASVPRLLGSVAAQTRPADEVVCVDAGSSDSTLARLHALSAALPMKVLARGRLNPGEARNEGVRAASHPWIAFTDGGIELSPRWMEALLAAVEPGIDIVFGSYEPVCDSFFRECAAVAYVPPLRREGIRGPFVGSMVLSRRAFEAAGGFPPYRAAEDLVFLERLAGTSFRAAFAPQATCRWETASTPTALVRRFALYSQANLNAGRGRYWHRGVLRQYLAVLAVVSGLAWSGAGLAGFLLVPLWFLARAVKAAWQKRGTFPFLSWSPPRVVGAALVLVLIDAATLAGSVRWLRARAARAGT
jgi:glycosyltransferase involved in cell wall biosynthesis